MLTWPLAVCSAFQTVALKASVSGWMPSRCPLSSLPNGLLHRQLTPWQFAARNQPGRCLLASQMSQSYVRESHTCFHLCCILVEANHRARPVSKGEDYQGCEHQRRGSGGAPGVCPPLVTRRLKTMNCGSYLEREISRLVEDSSTMALPLSPYRDHSTI